MKNETQNIVKRQYVFNPGEVTKLAFRLNKQSDLVFTHKVGIGKGPTERYLAVEAEYQLMYDDFWKTVQNYITAAYNDVLVGNWQFEFQSGKLVVFSVED